MRYFLALALLLLSLTAYPQKKTTAKKKATPTVSSLKNEQASVKKKIKESEQQLSANEKDVSKRLKTLVALNKEIDSKRDSIRSLKREATSIANDIRTLEKQIATLERELADKKSKYIRSLRYMHRNRSVADQMMFIFSAKNFSQMYRRMRFMKEYATYQRIQGEQVKAKEREVKAKRADLVVAKAQAERLVALGEEEQRGLERKQGEQQKAVKGLQSKQKEIKKILTAQRKRDEELNRQIDKLIAEEIVRANKAAGNSNKGNKSNAKASSSGFKLSEEDVKLSSNFESNRGRLPIPITGQYKIVNSFGTYDVEGLKGVRLDNKGINIEGKAGAQARAIFDGEVSAVFSFGGTTGVMVRHGSYISVYCNLAKASVKKGQKVSTKQVLGTLGSDHTLQFQLRKEKTKLNPETWLGR